MPPASILVVEDERIVSKDLQITLQTLGYTISGVAYSAREAIEKAIETSPDVILMDIMLNDEITGIEAAAIIRSRKDIPLIYLTAYSDDTILQQAGITQPLGYLLKPFTERELRTAIEMALYRSQIEKQVRQQEAWFATAFRSIGDAVIATDNTCRIVFINAHAAALTGWSEQEALGMELEEVFTVMRESDRVIINNFRKTLAGTPTDHTSKTPLLLTTRTGSHIPIEFTETPIRDESHTANGIMLVFRDVSERRNIRRNVFDMARLSRENPSPVLRISDSGVVLYANPAGTALLQAWGIQQEEHVPTHIADIVAAALTMRATTTIEETTDDQKLYTLTIVPYTEERYVHLYANDITALRDSDSALRESNRRFRNMLEKVPLISLVLDTNGSVSFCNEYLGTLLGRSRDALMGIDWFTEHIPAPERIQSRQAFEEHLRGKQTPPPYFESYVMCSSGEQRLINWTTTALRDANGATTAIAYIGLDITERRRETKALRESEERYRQLVEMSPVGIIIHQNGTVAFCNTAASRILRAPSPNDLNGIPVLDLIAPEYQVAVRERISLLLDHSAEVPLIEERLVRLDGSVIDAEVVAIPTVYNNKPAVQVVFLDISERKHSEREAEKQFVRLQSLYGLLYSTRTLHSIADLHESALRTIERTLKVQHSALLLYDSFGVMRFVAWHNLTESYRNRTEGHSPWLPDDSAPMAIFITDVANDNTAAPFRDVLGTEGIRSLAFIPLMADGVLIGKFMLYLDEPHTFTQEEKLLIESIASHVEFAISGIRADQRLRESEEKFRSVSEKTSALIAIFRDSYLYINPAFEKLTGYSSAEAASMPYSQILDPSVFDGTTEAIERVQRQRQPVRRECFVRTRQGEGRWLDVVIDLIPYGGEEAFILTGVDITERRQNEFLIEAQKDILQMIAHGDSLDMIFPAVSSFVEQQSVQTTCLIYIPDSDGVFRPFGRQIPPELANVVPTSTIGDDDGFIASAIRRSAHVSECVVQDTHSAPDVRMACSYPVMDFRRNVLGVVVVVSGSQQGFSTASIRVIQIAAQLASIVLERDSTFAALEKALQKNFRRAVQNLQNHVFRIERRNNGELYYTLSEGRMAEIANMRTDEVEDIPLSYLYKAEVYDIMIPYLERAFAGEAVTFEETYENRWFLTTYEPFFNEAGQIEEVIGSSVEITAQKLVEAALRTSEERYRLIVDTLPIGIMKTTETEDGWRYEYTNAQASQQTGLEQEDFNTVSTLDFVHPDDIGILSAAWERWLENPESKAIHITYRFRHKKGHYIWLDNYAVRVTNPHTNYQEVIQMTLDITEQKKAEQELHAALAKERELNNLKTRFVSTVSHEFRTPLTGILMSTELLERYYDKLEPQQRQEEIAKIKTRVNELTELMDDFLLQSSVQSMAERLRPELMDIGPIASHCVHELRSILSENPHNLLSVIPDNLPVFYGDPRLLRHVVQNLLSNAIKYSPTNSTILFELRHEGTFIVIEVRDRGIGIPEEEVSRLFTPFFRASNTGKIKGTGLGLSIIKEFVEIHNGTISVQSKVGHGTTVVVRLPLEAGPSVDQRSNRGTYSSEA